MAQAIPFVIAAVVGGAIGAGTAALTSKTVKPSSVTAPPVPTRNVAAAAAREDMMLRRRRGAAANELTGGGAEAPSPGGKSLLGQ